MAVGRRLDKHESRARWQELRALWNAYDPIGVVTEERDDEYDAYIGDVMRMLEVGASQNDLIAYLRPLVTGHIGLSWSPYLAERTEEFAAQCVDWYRKKWLHTYV